MIFFLLPVYFMDYFGWILIISNQNTGKCLTNNLNLVESWMALECIVWLDKKK